MCHLNKETGLSFPDVSLYKDLCRELGISIDDLINGEKKSTRNCKRIIFLLIILFILIITFSLIFIFSKKEKEKENEFDYIEKNYKMSLVARNVEAFFKYRYDGVFPDYYGGIYISDDSNNVIVLIVKEKLPSSDSHEICFYNELFTVDDAIKIRYVKNSYNDLESIYNKINDYLINNEIPSDFNSVGIDIIKNKVVVNYVKVNEKIKNEFRERVVDSDLIEFESSLDSVSNSNECKNYPKELGTDLEIRNSSLLLSIEISTTEYIPVRLNFYDDGTYELLTAYRGCKHGRLCTYLLIYEKSIKGIYNYDIDKIIEEIVNANKFSTRKGKTYRVSLGEKNINKYEILEYTVDINKCMYLYELLKAIDIDLNMCAKPIYD